MSVYLNYLILSSLVLAVYFIFYKGVLSKETFYKLNRVVLISILFMALVLPLFNWQDLFHITSSTTPITIPSLMVQLNEIIVSPTMQSHFSWSSLLFILYGVGAAFIFIKLLIGFIRLTRILKKGDKINLSNGIVLIVHNEEQVAPFSWMKFIVLSNKEIETNSEAILKHEEGHIYYKHSIDLLLMNLVMLLQWFNPFVWLLKYELEKVHEYQADQYVLQQGIDAKTYQLLLIRKSVGDYKFSLASSYNYSYLKNRISMMLKKKSNRWQPLKILYVVPLTVLLAFGLGCSDAKTDKVISSEETQDELVVVGYNTYDKDISGFEEAPLEEMMPVKTEVYTVVEKMPSFPGGTEGLMKYLAQNIKYPVVAQKEGKQGRVIVQYIIDADGSIRNVNVVRSIDTSLDAEAVRVVESMPKWEPGMQNGEKVSVKYTLPVMFKLQK